MDDLELCLYDLESFQTIWKVSRRSGKFPDDLKSVQIIQKMYIEHIWTMLMHKILQNHLLCAFVANLKIDAIYALYTESFCDKSLAIRKVFAFCDSGTSSNSIRKETGWNEFVEEQLNVARKNLAKYPFDEKDGNKHLEEICSMT